jgi:hypothetical protein
MMMFWGLQVAWSQVHHQASVSGITNRGKTRRPRAQDHRLCHVRHAARPAVSSASPRNICGDDHSPARRTGNAGCPLPQSSVVMDASPPCLAGRKQLRKLLIVEGCPMLSPDQSQTVIIRPRPAR